jgi:hypothetical protein
MSGSIAWMAAEADGDLPESPGRSSEDQNPHFSQTTREVGHPAESLGSSKESQKSHPVAQNATRTGHPADIAGLPAHQFPGRDMRADTGDNSALSTTEGDAEDPEYVEEDYETQRARRIYRGRTIAMLRRYMRYSIETGRLPSLLGREFFRTQVTSYTVVTFEDRVIFVHDMERCLDRLDEFSRQLIARHILQEHDQAATGRLLHCTERTVRTYVPITLDLLSEILLEVGLLEKVDSN